MTECETISENQTYPGSPRGGLLPVRCVNGQFCDAPGVIGNSSAPSGKELKYARRELERRFLLSQLPTGEATAIVEPAPDGAPGLITTTYLCEAEFELLATLPAVVLTKTRHSIPPLGVDAFDGERLGLVMAEIEFDREEDFRAFTPPNFVVHEVTYDVRFTAVSSR